MIIKVALTSEGWRDHEWAEISIAPTHWMAIPELPEEDEYED